MHSLRLLRDGGGRVFLVIMVNILIFGAFSRVPPLEREAFSEYFIQRTFEENAIMLNELDLLRSLLPTLAQGKGVVAGPGDDCAILETGGTMLQLAAVDQLIEGVHFLPETDPAAAGAKLMNRNLSDIAAMGGIPRFALLTIAAGAWSEERVLTFCRGAERAGRAAQVSIVGGDLAALPEKGFCATLSILGEVEPGKAVLRSGASAGEVLYVTGRIGNSFYSGRHLTFTPRLAEGRALAGRATAMLDVSDGLLLDAARLAKASKVALKIDLNKIPLHADASAPQAWSDGEDYELLFCAPPGLEKDWSCDLTPITPIGTVVPGNGELFDVNGELIHQERLGYEH